MAATRLLCMIASAAGLLSPLATAQYGPTCDALDSIAANTQCTRNDRCDTLDCVMRVSLLNEANLTLTILPCRDPASVSVVAVDSVSGEGIIGEIYDHTVTEIDLSLHTTLNFTVDQLGDAIGIEAVVNINVIAFMETATLVPYTVVPLDSSSCTSVLPSQKTIPISTIQKTTAIPQATTLQLIYATQDSVVMPTPTTHFIFDTPAPTIQQTTVMSTPTTQKVTATPQITKLAETPSTTPANKTTCDVLAELANNSEIFDCVASTREPCDRIDCATELIGIRFSAKVVLLPCYTPPAVQIAMSRDGNVVKNKTVSQSQEIFIPELFNLKLYVTLDHYKGAIGLQVDAEILFQSRDPTTIFKYAIIPLYNCKKGDFHSASNSALETTSAVLSLIFLLWFTTEIVHVISVFDI